jgi:hemerythrin-like domain-containing protein
MADTAQRDVVEVLTHDHREVEEMFAELDTLRAATDEASLTRRKDLTDQVIIELVRHSVAEEAVVYPVVRRRFGDEDADEAIAEHSAAEKTMKRLDGMRPDDPAFLTELDALKAEIQHHVAEEEGEMFARMRREFSPEELVELGAKVERLKKVAPTRPHPSAPDRPPGDVLLGPLTGLVDRVRDALSGRGTGE